MSDRPTVTVIMPTGALAVRATVIRRALDSVLSQEGVRVIPTVVVNGPGRDESLVRELRADSRLRVLSREPPSLPGAMHSGRGAVDTEWFCALDDDDEYLPGTLQARVQALRDAPEFDTVICSGLVRKAGVDERHPEDLAEVQRAPLEALTRGNWLLPGAWLCRTDAVGPELFRDMPRWLECTYLALMFCLHHRPCFLDRPGVCWYVDTPASESKSRPYVEGQVPAVEQLLAMPLPPSLRDWALKTRTAACHDIADLCLHERELANAWSWHLRSLSGRGGARYLSFTLRLLVATLGRRGHDAHPLARPGD